MSPNAGTGTDEPGSGGLLPPRPGGVIYDFCTMTALERVPGKVGAVHLSYRSREAERGTTPAWPSYFRKPSSTLAQSGEPVARPPGCELLAFDGEVALVIGRRARRVSR